MSALNTRLDAWVTDDLATDARSMAEAANASVSEVVRSALRFYTRQRPIYSFDGHGQSWVRDLWMSRHPTESDDPVEASQRLKAFHGWVQEAKSSAVFTTSTTSTASQLIPPQYQPLLSSFTQDRPLYAAATHGDITNGTVFTAPGQLADAQVDAAVGATSEGSNRTDNAAATFTNVTVTPAGITGLYRVTRELVDSSNPAIDAVALSAMRESYGRQTEAKIFTELNTVQSGTITGLQVPNGAQARTSTGTGLPADLRKAILDFGGIRGMRPRVAVASMRQTVAEGLDGLDASTVPAGADFFYLTHGVPVYLSPQISGVASTDGDVFITGTGDLWAWASPMLEFTYYERQGPALIDLAVFGYFAVRVLNPRGISSIRHT